MRCKVCGNESGKYPLCRVCNTKKEQGLVIKCTVCGNWHYTNSSCPQPVENNGGIFIYEVRKTLISKNERSFYNALIKCVPDGYHVFPQVNLAAFIDRTDNVRFHNELFRNVDFLITDNNYSPRLAVEINDSTHLERDRRERDERVSRILEEAGLPLMKLWTSYGVNIDYINKKTTELLNTPVVRIKHSVTDKPINNVSELPGSNSSISNSSAAEPLSNNTQEHSNNTVNNSYNDKEQRNNKRRGCYIATCVYGSYDCPSVWTLRRFRDEVLNKNVSGRLFIKLYYAVSPTAVRLFGNNKIFRSFWKKRLDKLVNHLNEKGIENTKYIDK